MKNKTAHAKILSLLLAFVMVLSTAAVFAEDPPTDPATDNQLVQDEGATVQQNSMNDNDETPDAEQPDGNASEEPEATEPETPAAPEVVLVLSETEKTIEVGDSFTLTATLSIEGEYTVAWTSDNEAATVSDAGVVTGATVGTANITATVRAGEAIYTGSCAVTVTERSFTAEKPVAVFDKKYDSGYESKNDNGYNVTWTQRDRTGVDAYQILRNSTVIATVDKSESEYFLLATAGTYNYTVRAVKYAADGKTVEKYIDSAANSIKISGVITSTHAYTWYCKTKKKVKTGGVTIPKGTTLTAVGRYPAKIKKFKNPKKVQVIYKGKKVWVPYNKLKGGVKAVVNVKSDYSRSLKEYMVNTPGAFSKNTKEASAIRGKTITSKDNTLLWACLYTQRVYTFKKSGGKWVLAHSDRITTGKFSHPTRSSETSGIYTINKKKSGKVWMVQENGKRYYFTHASYITKGVSFHTGTWWASGKKRGTVVASGKPGTYGCIRMYSDKTAKSGAQYIYANTTLNKTGVIVTRFD